MVRRKLSLVLVSALVSALVVIVASPASAATLVADYEFDDTLASSVGSPPDLVDIEDPGALSYVTENVLGVPRTVRTFPQGSGLQLPTVSTVLSDTTSYSVTVLFRFSSVTVWRRIAGWRNPPVDAGLYVGNVPAGSLAFFGGAAGPGAQFVANRYHQVVLTRTAGTVTTGYLDGVQQFTFNDNLAKAAVDVNDVMHFFTDDNNEESAGSVARIRLYDGALTAAEVAALNPLSECSVAGHWTNADNLKGTSGDDVICGLGGNDTLTGLGGADLLSGGAGTDRFLGGKGDDTIDGGTGVDTALYQEGAVTGGVTASLAGATPTATAGGLGTDSFVLSGGVNTIENLEGTSFVDSITGNNVANVLDGRGGNDSLFGGDGDDTLIGSSGADALNGQGGNDRLQPGAGDDAVDGGSGIGDTVKFNDAVSGVTLTLNGFSSTNATGGSGTDSVVEVEWVTGSAFDDTFGLSFTDGDLNVLQGNLGNDSLNIQDGASEDVADGGGGSDTCAEDGGEILISCND
jgi:Ca2+-binding RTX toxin-like protein